VYKPLDKSFVGSRGGFLKEPLAAFLRQQIPGILSATFAKNGRVIFKELDIDGTVTRLAFSHAHQGFDAGQPI